MGFQQQQSSDVGGEDELYPVLLGIIIFLTLKSP